jgi:tetratricopeptide (TPR) repeat protein
MLVGLWAFLTDPINREVLSWGGGGFVALSGGIWAVLKFLARKGRGKGSSEKEMVLAQYGAVAAGRDVVMGSFTQNYGLDADAVEERIATPLHEALSAIRIELAAERGVDPATLLPLFEHLGHRDLTLAQMRKRAAEAIAQIIALSKQRVEPSNEGGDIDAVILAARQKLAKLDIEGARSLLRAKVVEEAQTYRRGLVSLLTVQATIELISFDYGAARTTLTQLLEIDPNSVPNWLDLGDVYQTIGALEDAQNAYQSAIEAAQRVRDERHFAIALVKLSDTQSGRGDLDAAVKCCKQALAILHNRAMRMDDPIRQHDLSVCLAQMGDLQAKQRDYPAALKSYNESLAIGNRLRKWQPENVEWQYGLFTYHANFGVLPRTQGNNEGAAEHFHKAIAIARRLSSSEPRSLKWSADLALLLMDMGDAQHAEGDVSGALKAYCEGLSIVKQLSKSHPENVEWHHNTFELLQRIGDLQNAQNEVRSACEAYRESVGIAEELATAFPNNLDWQHSLSLSRRKLADVQAPQQSNP